MAPQKGSNSLSGRELRALMRSNQERDAGTVDTKPGSTRGEPHPDKHSSSSEDGLPLLASPYLLVYVVTTTCLLRHKVPYL